MTTGLSVLCSIHFKTCQSTGWCAARQLNLAALVDGFQFTVATGRGLALCRSFPVKAPKTGSNLLLSEDLFSLHSRCMFEHWVQHMSSSAGVWADVFTFSIHELVRTETTGECFKTL